MKTYIHTQTPHNQAVACIDKDKFSNHELHTLINDSENPYYSANYTNIQGCNVYLKHETENRLTVLISGHDNHELANTIKHLS